MQLCRRRGNDGGREQGCCQYIRNIRSVAGRQRLRRAFAAAMAAVVIWSLFALYFGLPTSEGHALMAALAGAAARIGSPDAFDGALWATVACGVFLSTVPTALASAAVAGGIERLIAKKRVSGFRLKKLQVTGAALTCFAHGAQDGQKFAGVFTVAAALCMRAPEKTVTVPLWTAILSALLISSGMLLGGKKNSKINGCIYAGGACCLYRRRHHGIVGADIAVSCRNTGQHDTRQGVLAYGSRPFKTPWERQMSVPLF